MTDAADRIARLREYAAGNRHLPIDGPQWALDVLALCDDYETLAADFKFVVAALHAYEQQDTDG